MRYRRGHAAAVSILLGALLLAGCTLVGVEPLQTTVPPEPPQAFELVLLHTNDVRGFTEPCG